MGKSRASPFKPDRRRVSYAFAVFQVRAARQAGASTASRRAWWKSELARCFGIARDVGGCEYLLSWRFELAQRPALGQPLAAARQVNLERVRSGLPSSSRPVTKNNPTEVDHMWWWRFRRLEIVVRPARQHDDLDTCPCGVAQRLTEPA
jgi:hypothetical protein